MSKLRIHELAKELNINSKIIIEKVKEYGVEASSHMSTVDADTANKIRNIYKPKEAAKETQKLENQQPKKAEDRPKQEPQKKEGFKQNNQKTKAPSQHQNTKETPKNDRKPQNTNQSSGQKTTSNNKGTFNKNTFNNKPQSGNKPGFEQKKTQENQQKGGKSNFNKPSANQNRNNFNGKNQSNRNNKKQEPLKQPAPKPVEPVEEEVKIKYIPEVLTVKEFAAVLGKSGAEIVKLLFKKGHMLSINSEIDFETASQIADEYNVILEIEEEKDIFEEAFKDEVDDEASLTKRPPVVVVMGHVDHGKTSLLDAIRKARVTAGEAGGITQHIGAYTVEIEGNPITFLDTPGHEAFTAMRMRGAQVTDIAILVVAADDGVMPQTVEAINHAKAAGVEIIVAVNKIDKVGANPDRVKQELTEHGILTEDWGGETICVPVSALNKIGIDTLLEMIILAAEMKELKANPNKKARGTVIDAQLDKGRGPVATILVQDGTLSVGDPVVAGSAYGKIRAMMDDKGRRVKKAGPSTPVEILGLSEVPTAGDAFYAADNDKQARSVAESVVAKSRTDMIKNSQPKVSLDDLFTQIQSGNVKELNIVVKADVQGSVEAVRQSLEKLSNDEVRVRIIHGGVGTITESDVMLASASNAIIIGFNVRPEPMAKTFADTEKVDLRLYRVIYNAIEDIMTAMKGMLDPVYEEKIIGHAEIRQVFKASGIGSIAGSYVTDGKFQRGCKVRVFRGNDLIHTGELESLKRFKDDVKEVNTNYECGLVIKKFNDFKEGDTVEAYIMVEVPR